VLIRVQWCICDHRINLLAVFAPEIFGEQLAGISNQLKTVTVLAAITIFSLYVDYPPHFMGKFYFC